MAEAGAGGLAASGEQDAIEVEFPDGVIKEYRAGVTALEIARAAGAADLDRAVAARLDGQVVDLTRPLTQGGRLRLLTFADVEGREVYRHTAAHVLAQAVKRLFPGARLAVGPALEDGFYYDVETPRPLGPEDLERIEEEMRRIVAEDLPVERLVLAREEAERLFADLGEPYKLEIIREIPPEDEITAYRQGEFVDLCRGPHLPSTGRLGAIKLLSVSGAYWRGDERGPMLQRVYGTAFAEEAELEHFLWQREEARRRDHRRLGPELGLFSFHPEAPGFAFWQPKGTVLYNLLIDLSRRIQARHGYQEVMTPAIMDVSLWRRSGHWDHYRDNMYFIERDDEVAAVKPMNCPGHCLLYRERVRSYRDLPMRISEYGRVARFERSGTLHGLLRVRGFVQDDAHLFVREDQIEDEILSVLEIIDEVYRQFEMSYTIKLSTRPADFMGDPALWDRAEAALAAALERAGRAFDWNPGEGAFYGPKLDCDVLDSLGRRWQLATVQLDFQLPEKFDLTYRDRDGRERRPVMIHRAIMGSLERFIGILVEHYAGAFPFWLAPVQAVVLPIADRHHAYAAEVVRRLAEAGFRAEADLRGEKIGARIRDAQLQKVPYMLVVGDREREQGLVSLRHRSLGDLGAFGLEEVLARFRTEAAGPGAR